MGEIPSLKIDQLFDKLSNIPMDLIVSAKENPLKSCKNRYLGQTFYYRHCRNGSKHQAFWQVLENIFIHVVWEGRVTGHFSEPDECNDG